uniref:Uncharacterized protein n=1 Tax=Arundo donax TaxID=35708 RepID=A0A0A9AFZ8_ARUDO
MSPKAQNSSLVARGPALLFERPPDTDTSPAFLSPGNCPSNRVARRRGPAARGCRSCRRLACRTPPGIRRSPPG